MGRKKEYNVFGFDVVDHINAEYGICPRYTVVETTSFKSIANIINWLNAHHFDYRGLIEQGLALQSPEGMYQFV